MLGALVVEDATLNGEEAGKERFVLNGSVPKDVLSDNLKGEGFGGTRWAHDDEGDAELGAHDCGEQILLRARTVSVEGDTAGTRVARTLRAMLRAMPLPR